MLVNSTDFIQRIGRSFKIFHSIHMESLSSRIDQEALNWADQLFVKMGFTVGDGGDNSGAQAPDILGMERHIAECMWALVRKCKSLGEESPAPGVSKAFYHLTKLLCEVGLSEEISTGMFLPVPKHQEDQKQRSNNSNGSANEELLTFPSSGPAIGYEQHAEIIQASPLRYHHQWTPLLYNALFSSEPSGAMLQFMDHYYTESETPVNAVLEDSVSDAPILIADEGFELLKQVRAVTPWAFSIYDEETDFLPLHRAVDLLVSRELLQAIVQYNPAAVMGRNQSSYTPMHALVTALLEKEVAGGDLEEEDIKTLEYLISITPPETLLVQSDDGDTALHLALSHETVDYQKPRVLSVPRLLFDACPAAAQVLSGKSALPIDCFNARCIKWSLRDVNTIEEVDTKQPNLARLLRDLFAATGDAIRIADSSGRSCLHRMCKTPCLPLLRLVCEAYPEALQMNVPRVGTPLHVVLAHHDWNVNAAVYILNKSRASIDMKDPVNGITTLHSVLAAGDNLRSSRLVRFILDRNPTAIFEKTASGDLPIHSLLNSSILLPVGRVFVDILRLLLRRHPQSASIPNNARDTPYDLYWLCIGRSDIVDRMFLTACPHLDLPRFKKLNYEARRGALYVLHQLQRTPPLSPTVVTASTSTGVERSLTASTLTGVERSFQLWWSLANHGDMSIVKEVVSFL